MILRDKITIFVCLVAWLLVNLAPYSALADVQAMQRAVITKKNESGSNGLLTGLSHYWKLEESSGTRVDSHGSHNLSPFLVSPGGGTGIIDDCVDLESDSTQSLGATDSGSVMTPTASGFSISMWINMEGSSSFRWLATKSTSNTAGEFALYKNSSHQITWLIIDNSASARIGIITTSTISTATWYHLVATWDGGTSDAGMTIYINGSAQSTTTSNANTFADVDNTTLSFEVGEQVNSWHWDGLIDELGVWARELSSDDVTALYNSGSGLSYDSFD